MADSTPLLEPSAVVLNPGNINAAWRGRRIWAATRIPSDHQRRSRSRITPSVHLGVAVGKRKPGRLIVIHPGQVSGPGISTRIGRAVTGHVGHEVAPVHPILAHVEEDKDL